jgi:glycosyltransferase involved in cell wall biosynthesis
MSGEKLKEQLSHYTGSDQHSLLLEDGSVNTEARGAAPTEAELSNEYTAPGDEALLGTGIIYSADWKTHADGMAKHAREQILALASTGLPLRLESIGSTGGMLEDELHPDVLEASYLQGVSLSSTLISIKQLVLWTPDHLRNIVCGASGVLSAEHVDRVYKSTIVYTSWERDCVHPDLVEVLNRLGQVWVPCHQNVKAFIKSGVRPRLLRVVPYPFNPSSCKIAAPRGSEEISPHRRYYNIGKWEPRKNQHRLLGAFLLAHKPKDRATLFIKTSPFGSSWANYPDPAASVDYWLKDKEVKKNGWTEKSLDRLVRIVDVKVSDEEMLAIHERNNIYVSAAAGEAWDIPAFDAKCAGNRLVHVGFGGSEDYAEKEDVAVPYTLGPVHPGYRWEENAQWAHYTAEQLAEAMKAAQVPSRRVMAKKLAARFGRAVIGQKMKVYIYDLAHELGCLDLLMEEGGFG